MSSKYGIDPQFMVMLKGKNHGDESAGKQWSTSPASWKSFHHESAGVDMPNPPRIISTGVDSGLVDKKLSMGDLQDPEMEVR